MRGGACEMEEDGSLLRSEPFRIGRCQAHCGAPHPNSKSMNPNIFRNHGTDF